MRIALVALSSDPLAAHLDPRSAAEAARVISLARELASMGHRITVYSRRDARELPGTAIAAPGVTLEHVTAGPPKPLGQEELPPAPAAGRADPTGLPALLRTAGTGSRARTAGPARLPPESPRSVPGASGGSRLACPAPGRAGAT